MAQAVERAVRELPLLTRAQVMEEAGHDPGFWSYFAPLALSHDPGRVVDAEMMRAAINALDPARYRDSGVHWPMFQRKLREIRALIADHAYIESGVRGLGVDPGAAAAPAAPAANVWSAIGSVLSSVTTAAANIYATRITTSAQRQVSATQAQVAAAQAQAAIQPLPPGALGPPAAGPSIAVYALLGLVGIGGLLLLMKAMGRRR